MYIATVFASPGRVSAQGGQVTQHPQGFHDLGKGGSSYLEYLQRRRDALHGARDLGRDRAARRQSAGLPRLAWVHPGLFFTQSGEESEPEAAGKFEWNPDKSSSGPVSLLVSSADKTLYVYRNGVEISRAGMPNSNTASPLNNRVFSALNGTDE